jgi:non-ribosomal peptide synthetase component E (peptide arylation enzyme)
MRPTLVSSKDTEAYLATGHWSRDTMLDRYHAFASEFPDKIACRDDTTSFTWAQLDEATNILAANLITLGIKRDETALVQMPSSCQEMLLRVGLKKAGIIGAFAPLQWRRKELDYVVDRIKPRLVVFSCQLMAREERAWLDRTMFENPCVEHRIDLANSHTERWLQWSNFLSPPQDLKANLSHKERHFRYDEVSLITVSSGTSGIAKLCEWPEGSQVCMGSTIAERMGITADDIIGIFAPMSGAAGLLVWTVSGKLPCSFIFPRTYGAKPLLDLAQRAKVSVITTVPVILARLEQEPLQHYDLRALRLLRVGTAAADLASARAFEEKTECRVIVASGAMECPGFGHADANESKELRLNGSVGLPLRGCQLRIEDEKGNDLPSDTIGELKVAAPFASSGYWKDAKATEAVWSEGWYATGDMGVLDQDGRLTLRGRLKETINRSGHKILPAEVESEISRHPDVFACAVGGAPASEYGAVPWAFVQMQSGRELDTEALTALMNESGLANYKIPQRFISIAELPRINDNKVDKKALLASVREALN